MTPYSVYQKVQLLVLPGHCTNLHLQCNYPNNVSELLQSLITETQQVHSREICSSCQWNRIGGGERRGTGQYMPKHIFGNRKYYTSVFVSFN